MAKKQIKLSAEQVKELKTLCEAVKAAEEAKKIRGRFKAFMEDNEEAHPARTHTPWGERPNPMGYFLNPLDKIQ